MEIYVVSHKYVRMPKNKIYIPIQVGNNPQNFKGYLRDNTGDNISDKNSSYCELTAQYWASKNRFADVKGIVHYRRLFTKKRLDFLKPIKFKWNDIVDYSTIDDLISHYDVILPFYRNYYIETLWSHYEHSHHIEGLKITREIISRYYPSYLKQFDIHMNDKKGHMFNIFIAKSDIFDDYTNWLIDVLSKVEDNIDITSYSKSEQRIFGYISELLMDVWIRTNNVSYAELPVTFMGNQHWPKKIFNFLKRKIKN